MDVSRWFLFSFKLVEYKEDTQNKREREKHLGYSKKKKNGQQNEIKPNITDSWDRHTLHIELN